MKRTNYDINRAMAIIAKAVRTEHGKCHISRGNNKTGEMGGFSLPAGYSCTMEACAHCLEEGCYALKNMLCHGYDRQKNNVLNAWTDNVVLVLNNLDEFEAELDRYFDNYKLPDFRIHPSGDFINEAYGWVWYRQIAKRPQIAFLGFSKQWDVLRAVPFYSLENSHIRASGWEGCPVPEDIQELYPCSHCIEHGQTPPEDAVECGIEKYGSCNKCPICKGTKKNVYFWKH